MDSASAVTVAILERNLARSGVFDRKSSSPIEADRAAGRI